MNINWKDYIWVFIIIIGFFLLIISSLFIRIPQDLNKFCYFQDENNSLIIDQYNRSYCYNNQTNMIYEIKEVFNKYNYRYELV